MEAAKGSVKAVALIIGDNNVRGSLQFVQYTNGSLSLSLSLASCFLVGFVKHESYLNLYEYMFLFV